jgi:hypothetical protein
MYYIITIYIYIFLNIIEIIPSWHRVRPRPLSLTLHQRNSRAPETSQSQSLEQADESQRRSNDQPDYGEGNDQPDHEEENYYMVEGGNEADDKIIDEDEQDIPCETVKRKGAPAIEKVNTSRQFPFVIVGRDETS